MRIRNCGEKYEAARFVIGSSVFSQCPVSWLLAHPVEAAFWEIYTDCCGRNIGDGFRFLPLAGGVFSQPHPLYEGLRVIFEEVALRFQSSEEQSQDRG